MRAAAAALLLLLLSVVSSLAQTPVTAIGAITPGHCANFFSTTQIQDSGSACGGGGGGGIVGPGSSTVGDLAVWNNATGTALADTNLSFPGGFSFAGTLTGPTTVTFPLTGNLVPGPASSTVGDLAVWNSTTGSLGDTNLSFVGAFSFAGTLTGPTAVTFPTSGTLATTATANVASVTGTAGQITVTPTTGAVVVSLPATITANLTLSGTVNNTGVAQLNGVPFGTFATQNFATPPAIGGTTAAAGAFTTLSASGNLTTNVTGGGIQCLQASNTGVVSGIGGGCNAVSSVSGTAGQITVSPTTGAVVVSLPATITANETFSGTVTLTNTLTTNVTGGGTQCLQASNTGVLSGTGSACGAGGGTPGGASGSVQFNNSGAFGGFGIWTPGTPNTLQFAADAAAPVGQLSLVSSVLGGTTNTAGALWDNHGSLSTGTGAAGAITYGTGFAGVTTSVTATITIATPAVVTMTAHGFVPGQVVRFTTTGTLPTGLALLTNYYVLATGLTVNAFQLSATPGGAAIATSGAQSGTHTGTAQTNVQNPATTVLTLGPSGLTGSQTTALLLLAQTWNTTGIVDAPIKVSVTNIASANTSLLMDFQYNAATALQIVGNANYGGGIVVGTIIVGAGGGGTTGKIISSGTSGPFVVNNGASAMTLGVGNYGGVNNVLTVSQSPVFVRTASGAPYTWSSTTNSEGAADTGLSRLAANVVAVGNGTAADVTGAIEARSFVGRGAAPTFTGTCTAPASSTGGNTAGTWTVGAAGACTAGTYILTFAFTAPNGWSCNAQDQTTPADTVKQTANSATTATFTATTANNDVVAFNCMAF